MPFLEEEASWAGLHGRKVKRIMFHSKTRKKVSVPGMRKQRVKQCERVRPLWREVSARIWGVVWGQSGPQRLAEALLWKVAERSKKKRFWEITLGWKYYIGVQSVIWRGGKVGVVIENDQVRELASQVLSGSSSWMLKLPKVITSLEVEMKTLISVPEVWWMWESDQEVTRNRGVTTVAMVLGELV